MEGQGNLQDLIREDIANQGQNIAAQKEQLNALLGQKKQTDLTPLMALADAWSGQPGSNLAQVYQHMKPKDNTAKGNALKQQLMQQEQGLLGKKMALLKLAQSGKKKTEDSVFQKKVDAEIAKDYIEWNDTGKQKDLGNLKRLELAYDKLGEEGDLANTALPKAVRDFTHPESAKVQEDIEFVAQQSLKKILGGQFSKTEGEQLIKRTYNPRLSDDLNREKLRPLMDQLQAILKEKSEIFDHVRKAGTMRGYKDENAYQTITDWQKEKADDLRNKFLKPEEGKENKKGNSELDALSEELGL